MVDSMSVGLVPSTVAVMLLFGSVIFATAAMAARTWVLRDNRALAAAWNTSMRAKGHSEGRQEAMGSIAPLEQSFISIYVLLHHLSLLGVVLFVVFLAENHPPFPHSERHDFDSDRFFFLLGAVVLLGWCTTQTNEKLIVSAASEKPNFQHLTAPADRPASNARIHDEASSLLPSLSDPCEGPSLESVTDQSIAPARQRKRSPLGPLTEYEDSTVFAVNDAAASKQEKQGSVKDTADDNASTHTVVSPTRTKSINDVLNVPQTLEWKGFMTAAFLIYEVTSASTFARLTDDEDPDFQERAESSTATSVEGNFASINPYYNAARLCTTSFVFMTGYDHTSFFFRKDFFSPVRVLHILFRINLIGFFLCLTLGNRYIFYSACAVHSYFFLLVYFTMRIKRQVNYTMGLRTKMLVLGAFIFLIWDCNLGLFQLFHGLFFRNNIASPSAGVPYGPLWEWYYRSHIHHWASYMGMIYALNHPIISLFFQKVENLGRSRQLLCNCFFGVAFAVTLFLWGFGRLHSSKVKFTSTHPYFGFVPVACYVFLRNCTRQLRMTHVGLFRFIGSYCLELYLLRNHLLLAGDGMTILVLVPGYPMCNVVLVSALLVVMAVLSKTVATVLCKMTIPTGRIRHGARNLLSFVALFLALYGVGIALDFMNVVNPGTIAVLSAIMGLVLYQTIVALTWDEYRTVGHYLDKNSNIYSSDDSHKLDEALPAKATPLAVGVMTLLLLGASWHGLGVAGALRPYEPLSSACEEAVNEGHWVPIDSCSEHQRGVESRDFGVGGYYKKCGGSPSMQWGWTGTSSASKCRFYHRHGEELQYRLGGKSVVFIGDSSARQLFQAITRALDPTSEYGQVNTPFPEDDVLIASIAETTLSFIASGGGKDMVGVLSELNEQSSQRTVPDILVVGGVFSESETTSTDDLHGVISLVETQLKAIKDMSTRTILLLPPAENKDASENESNVEDTRHLYEDDGLVSAADFVIDAFAFTSEREKESHSGLDYPAEVFDAGAQIFANSLDWLLPQELSLFSKGRYNPEWAEKGVAASRHFFPPKVGTMSNPFLGLLVICVAFIALFHFDSFFGFTYVLAGLMSLVDRGDGGHARGLLPRQLYKEAMTWFQERQRPEKEPASSGSYSIVESAPLGSLRDFSQANFGNGRRIV